MNIITTLSILLFGTTILGIASPAQAWLLSRKPLVSDPPEDFINALFTDISQSSGLPVSDLEIVNVEQARWSNGCMSFRGSRPCTMALVGGLITTIQNDNQRWVYHKSRLAQQYQWNVNPETQNWVYSMTDFTYSPFNPIIWDFEDENYPFFNPSSVQALQYTTLNDTFTIDVQPDSNIFNPGATQRLRFDIDIPEVFNPETYRWSVSYQAEVLEKPDSTPQPVPEPGTVGALGFLGLLGLKSIGSRKRKDV
ncbi:PEP-CTERM sorting domain-containing protein [Roseofilum sp. BLCC_M91]|uniref:PEP-CTERM sorting domain-containing protein n=1 Tax=Roseofilum halophilum BLCC-M91 TaxID=3022259 RepID=A0ABT7BIN1_9CYAN|nr:PEP-CTERM sorting domain-containing protein [Roseofilum halophilum]MDJ1178444.1 PEP-CTERM sorting domain-containing protein [Roseofilum halophilum BLCC-M91]